MDPSNILESYFQTALLTFAALEQLSDAINNSPEGPHYEGSVRGTAASLRCQSEQFIRFATQIDQLLIAKRTVALHHALENNASASDLQGVSDTFATATKQAEECIQRATDLRNLAILAVPPSVHPLQWESPLALPSFDNVPAKLAEDVIEHDNLVKSVCQKLMESGLSEAERNMRLTEFLVETYPQTTRLRWKVLSLPLNVIVETFQQAIDAGEIKLVAIPLESHE